MEFSASESSAFSEKDAFCSILGMRVHEVSYVKAVNAIINWAKDFPYFGRYVCASNVHMCMEAFDDPFFRKIINNADMVVPDGKPLVWAMRLLRCNKAIQVRGSDLFIRLCKAAEEEEIPVGFYGGSEQSLADFLRFVMNRFPTLKIPFFSAPPFRALIKQEEEDYLEAIRTSGIRILFIGIGCPKQEKWMAAIRDRVPCVMVGIGAAFDFFSGRKKHAPVWMQKAGIEWVFRLANDPRRLWRRYLKHNPRFILFFLRQLLKSRHQA